MALVSCQNVSFSYNGHVVVKNLNFDVNSGDYLCIVGENGSGKSTLITGLLRLKTPHTGTIHMDKELKPNEIGYLPQQTPMQKDFPASVLEIVLSGRLGARGMRPFYSRQDLAAAKENMKRFDIADIKDKCFRDLSGGQQQRVLLARALCAAKKLLLLDEPAAGLDPVVTLELYRLISEINQETGITVVMVSHDIHNAVRHASHILHLSGSQAFFGKTAEYIASAVGMRFLGGD